MGTPAPDDQAQAAHEDRSGVLALPGPPRDLGNEIHPETHRDPDDRLGGDRGHGVGARGVARGLVLDDDHMQFLHRQEQGEGDHGRARPDEQLAQRRLRRLLGIGCRQRVPKRHEQSEGDGQEGHRRAEEGAGHIQADAHQEQGEDDSGAGLPDDRQRHRPVTLEALQDAALDTEDDPQHCGERHGGGAPEVVDADDRADHRAQRDGRQRNEHRGDGQADQPAANPRAHVGYPGGALRAQLARDRDLKRRAWDHEDDVRRDEHRQRSVSAGAEDARKDDREDQRQHVLGDHGGAHAGRPPGVRAGQVREEPPGVDHPSA